MRTTPAFPLLGEPGEWDELTLLAATIALEGEGESDEGKVAIGYVVMNRVAQGGGSIHRVILGPDARAYGDDKPYEPFSCWGDDYKPMATARLTSMPDARAGPCWRAAAAALWGLLPDPTRGANSYLNVSLTLKVRPDHKLPPWAADPADRRTVDMRKVTVVIDKHTFLKA